MKSVYQPICRQDFNVPRKLCIQRRGSKQHKTYKCSNIEFINSVDRKNSAADALMRQQYIEILCLEFLKVQDMKEK